jgi:hypothetical protein
MKKILLFVVLFVLLLSSVMLAKGRLMVGVPLSRVIINDKGEVSESLLLHKDSQNNLCIIDVDEEGDYIWVTRGNVKMSMTESGLYRIFVMPNGAGLVKVISMCRYNDKNDIDYIEIVHQGLNVIIYTGKIINGDLY